MNRRELTLLVNGTNHRLTVETSEPLLWVLRDRLKLTGTKFGCGEGACGACSVLIDGAAYRSCVVAVGDVASGEAITTIEGLGAPGSLSALQQAFIDHTAFGCGFCTPGMIVTATAFLEGTANPSRQQIITAMDDNLCRCASHPAILDAIEEVAGSKREPED